MLPVTSRFSITAPSFVTWMEPLGVSFVPAGTPVFEALGFGPEHTEPPEPLELDVLAEPPALVVVPSEPPLPEELVVLAAPVVLDVVDVSLLLHAAPPATVAVVRTRKKR